MIIFVIENKNTKLIQLCCNNSNFNYFRNQVALTTITNEVNITNLNAPVFGISNMNTFDVVDFTFSREANCSSVQYASGGGQFKDMYSLSYSGGTQSPLVDNNPLISSYDLDYASLVISAINTVSLNVGDQVIDRDVIVNQGGNGCVQNFTHFVVIDTTQISNYIFKFNL